MKDAPSLRAGAFSRLTLYKDLLNAALPTWKVIEPCGGVSLWVDTGADAASFAQAALRQGVALVTGRDAAVDNRSRSFIRLPLALEAPVIEEGILRLKRAWDVSAGETGSAPARLIV